MHMSITGPPYIGFYKTRRLGDVYCRLWNWLSLVQVQPQPVTMNKTGFYQFSTKYNLKKPIYDQYVAAALY